MTLKLVEFIENNSNWEELLSQKPYSLSIKRDGGYILFMYSQIDSDFGNPIVRECRGLISLEETLRPVCVPFFKFFNAQEGHASKIDWSTARVLEKLDGSIIKLWFFDGWHVSTNGTIIYWLCECSCKEKTKTSVASRDLRNGHTKSCGCYKKEVEKEYLTLEGVTFGIIKVLKRVENTIQPNNTSKIQYLCKCECGNRKVIRAGDLKSGHSKSCGCLRESFISSKLKNYFQNNHEGIIEYRGLKNPKTKRWLRFDIYLPKEKVFIEIHGLQHYKLGNWHYRQSKNTKKSPEEEFEYQKYKDKIKKKFAKKNGLYIEVDLRKIVSFEKTILEIEEKINGN